MIALPFISAEEERSILLDRTPKRSAKFFEADLLLLVAGEERIPRVGFVDASEVIACPVPGIGAGLYRYTGDGAGLPSEFRLGILLGRELLNCVYRQQRCSIAGKADRINGALAAQRLHCRDAIENVHVVLRSQAVGHLAPCAAAGCDRNAGPERKKVHESSSISSGRGLTSSDSREARPDSRSVHLRSRASHQRNSARILYPASGPAESPYAFSRRNSGLPTPLTCAMYACAFPAGRFRVE